MAEFAAVVDYRREPLEPLGEGNLLICGPDNMACFFHSEPIKINVFYWYNILIERTDPK